MLKKSPSDILDTCEASFVSQFERFAKDEDGLPDQPTRSEPRYVIIIGCGIGEALNRRPVSPWMEM